MLATSVLVGMQPTFTQVPPNNLRSMMAAFMPSRVMRAARAGPDWPVPMMIASNFSAKSASPDWPNACGPTHAFSAV